MNILVLTSRHGYWKELAPNFATSSFTLDCTPSFDGLLNSLRTTPPILVILDPDENDGIELIKDRLTAIVRANAMVHIAIVSNLNDEAFHDAVEGYGVLLRIPATTEVPVARLIVEALRSVGVFA